MILKKIYKSIIHILILFVTIVCAANTLAQTTYPVRKVFEFTIDSSINPATQEYIEANYKKIEKTPFSLALIKINTPGGLVSVTKKIMTIIGEVSFPTVIWITPEGASATSAGAIIASSSHFLFMSEGTNIGAATPIQMSGDIKQKDARNKAINDLVALVSSLSKTRGRNPAPFKDMIDKGSSFDAKQAKEKKVINDIASDYQQILNLLNEKTFTLKGEDFQLIIEASAPLETVEMSAAYKLLDQLANPSTAYILFLIGALLIYLEFQTPGGFIAGSLGVVALIIAGIGFQVISLNFGALALLVAAFALFILEIYITSYGLLTMGALAALITGSLFLFDTDSAYLELNRNLIYSVVSGVAAFTIFLGWFFWKTRNKSQKEDEFFDLEGRTGTITNILDDKKYQVKVTGEVWKAESEEKFELGEQVKVDKVIADRLILILKKV